MVRKYDTTKAKTSTKIEVEKELWYRFKLISARLGKQRDDAMTEAIQDWNEKNKGVLG